MAMSSSSLKTIVYNAVRNSLINQTSGSMDGSLSPAEKAQAYEQLSVIARAVSEAVPYIIAHIQNYAEVTASEQFSSTPSYFGYSDGSNGGALLAVEPGQNYNVLGTVVAKGYIR